MEPTQPQEYKSRNPYVLPASILLAAVIIGASIVYLVKSGGVTGGAAAGAAAAPAVHTATTASAPFTGPQNTFSKCIDNRTYQALVQKQTSDANALGVNSTPTVFVNGENIQGAQPYTVFQAAIEAALAGKATSTIPDGLKPNKDDVVLGDPNAKVTLVEYGDYQCPFCGRFFSEVEPLIRQNYIQTGKVNMIFRNFEFLGPESEASAEASECAKDQGKFWEYHDALYSAKVADTAGGENDGSLNRDLFLKIANNLGLNAQ
jgi:protein-disulfide isomerase